MPRYSRPSRTPIKLSDLTNRRLNIYALGATAAGVGMLALSPLAEAKIVYTPANVKIVFGQAVPLDVNHDGVNDFFFTNNSFSGATNASYLRVSAGVTGNLEVAQFRGGQNVGASDLKTGVSVGPNRQFGPGETMAGYCLGGGTIQCHSFVAPWAHSGKGVKNRYLGLKFAIRGQMHYGWARLTVSMGPPFKRLIVGHLTGYAYETIPNKPIVTGKTKGPDVITVQPACLGNLARGASAISNWRVKRTAATAH